MFFSERFSKILIGIGIVVIIAFTIFFLCIRETEMSAIGQYGDFIGGFVGSLWALAGVVLFYVALKAQTKDFENNKKVLETQVAALEKQIEEFQLQREELELTREVFIEQSTTLKIQQFESTFFNSLNLLNSITNSIKVNKQYRDIIYRETAEGRESFMVFYIEFKDLYEKNNLHKRIDIELNIGSIDERNIELETINSIYIDFYKKNTQYLNHYFRTLFNIITLIDNKRITDSSYYISLLKAQLSSYETLILFYHSLSEYGGNFKLLIEKYAALDSINEELLIDIKHKILFESSAYSQQ